MSRSAFACRHCKAPLGDKRSSGILGLRPGVRIVFVDNLQQITVLLCPACGQRVRYIGGRIEPDQRQSA